MDYGFCWSLVRNPKSESSADCADEGADKFAIIILSTFAILEISMQNIDQLDARHFIIIKGARVHNLKNINVAIPRTNSIVIKGLSG